jgi:hypothetical protein
VVQPGAKDGRPEHAQENLRNALPRSLREINTLAAC